jgi:hypothetical protein
LRALVNTQMTGISIFVWRLAVSCQPSSHQYSGRFCP